MSPSLDDPGLLRLGVVSYLNALPLVRGLEEAPDVVLEGDPPSVCAARLAAGEIDVGLVPVVELLRYPELRVVSDACVGALGPVWSVLLLLRTDPEAVRTLVLDPHSGTSQVLARLILAEVYDVETTSRIGDPASAWGDGMTDAVLMIGDPALRRWHEGVRSLDLAEAWQRLTGLPFVFAVWAGRADVLARHPRLEELLAGARSRGLEELPGIAAEQSPLLQLPEDLLRVYLEERIRYRLAAAERAGLDRFLELARPMVTAE